LARSLIICWADTGFSEVLPVDDELVDGEWGTLSISSTIYDSLWLRGILCPEKQKTTIDSGRAINFD
jgi:hypothetical protein